MPEPLLIVISGAIGFVVNEKETGNVPSKVGVAEYTVVPD
jgi:hypothetical protein